MLNVHENVLNATVENVALGSTGPGVRRTPHTEYGINK